MSNDVLKFLRPNYKEEDSNDFLSGLLKNITNPNTIKEPTIQESRNDLFKRLMDEVGLVNKDKADSLYKQANPQLTSVDTTEGKVPYYLAKDVTPLATANPELNKILMAGVPGFGPETDRLPIEKQPINSKVGTLENLKIMQSGYEPVIEKDEGKKSPSIGKSATKAVEKTIPKETEVTPATQQMKSQEDSSSKSKYTVSELEKKMNESRAKYLKAASMLSDSEMGNNLSMLAGASKGALPTSEYVAQMKQAETEIENYKTLIEEERKEKESPLKLDQLKSVTDKVKLELDDEKAKQDPNSAISKFSRSLLQIMGQRSKIPYEVQSTLTASNVEKILGPIERYMGHLEAAETRKTISEQNALARQAAQQDKKEERQTRRQEDFINTAYNKVAAGKPYATMIKINNAVNRLEEAMRNPSAIKDVGALYETVKIFDPDSVVREGEISLTKQASNIMQNLRTMMSRLQSSGTRVVDPAIIKQMVEYAKFIQNDANSSYRQTIDPVLNQARKRGIADDDLSLIDPLYRGKSKKEEEKVEPKTSEKVKVSNGKETLLIDVEDLSSAEKDGYKRVQ